ncbi:hydantoinase B/oxoprolinase family protein [Roseovarius sp.]|uniref:hydantoinase B/oxoprolinase family protein n=1 Tax=Roseovarius sp. TaxID=1486281 RepID=UPI00356943EA
MTGSHIGQAIVTQALLAAAHEMGVKLIRSAHSPIVREAQDCSAAIINKSGQVVAQAELTAIQLGSISQTLAPCLQRFPPETLREGDFYISNDPYHMGQHVQDIFIFSPVFYKDELLGFTASVVHHIDLGGGAPGLNPNAADVHQEGIIFPPSKYNFASDWSGGPLEQLVAANVRMPEATIGDIYAQFAANSIGGKRLIALTDRYGAGFIRAAMDEMLNYSERRVRAAIGKLPDGTYIAESAIEDDGIGDTPIFIRGKIDVAGELLNVSFEGTDPQVATNINCPMASTVAAAVACAKSVLTGEDIPFNDGAARVITVDAPEGSILNPRRPAPVRARLLASHRVFNTVMKALAQAAPESVIAEGFDTTTPICFSSLGSKGYNIYLEILGGGYGAAQGSDGCDGVDCPLSNCSNIPIESIEMDYPFLRVEEYALLPDSGGRGRYRGGLGFCRSYRILEDGVTFSTYSDRFVLPAKGIFDGEAGAKASITVVRNEEEISLKSKCGFSLLKDDLVVVRTGGGGGYGNPRERNLELHARDRTQGLAG